MLKPTYRLRQQKALEITYYCFQQNCKFTAHNLLCYGDSSEPKLLTLGAWKNMEWCFGTLTHLWFAFYCLLGYKHTHTYLKHLKLVICFAYHLCNIIPVFKHVHHHFCSMLILVIVFLIVLEYFLSLHPFTCKVKKTLESEPLFSNVISYLTTLYYCLATGISSLL